MSIESVRSTNILYYHTDENGRGRAQHISKTNERVCGGEVEMWGNESFLKFDKRGGLV